MELTNLDQDGRNLAKSIINTINKISIMIDDNPPVVTRRLSTELTLEKVRELLSNSEEQIRIYEYMDFIGPYGIILRNEEGEELLKNNLHDGYILKIEKSINPNVNEAICRYNLNCGIKMTECGPKIINEKIFEFQDITQGVDMKKINYIENRYEGKCESKHENFLRKNLVAEGKISISMHLSVDLTISNGRQTNDTHNTEFSSQYKIILLPRYEIEIDVKKVQPSENFIQAVEFALNGNNAVEELRNVCENFGEYIARKVKIGGRMNKIVYYDASSISRQPSTDLSAGIRVGSEFIGGIGGNYNNINGHNESLSTSNVITHLCVYGGDESKFQEDNMASWQESLNDHTTWKIIEYVDLIPIFDVLKSELRQR
ncbi:3744_t:CDS:1, partial [Cetraspora pellucida]